MSTAHSKLKIPIVHIKVGHRIVRWGRKTIMLKTCSKFLKKIWRSPFIVSFQWDTKLLTLKQNNLHTLRCILRYLYHHFLHQPLEIFTSKR